MLGCGDAGSRDYQHMRGHAIDGTSWPESSWGMMEADSALVTRLGMGKGVHLCGVVGSYEGA